MRLEKDVEKQKILKLMCPGTALREGLENILRAKTGGLIVLSDSEEIMKIADGGFLINADYSAAYVYELAKMDGAIILSKDLKNLGFQVKRLKTGTPPRIKKDTIDYTKTNTEKRRFSIL